MNRSPFRAILTAQARYLAPVIALATIVTALLPLITLQVFPEMVGFRDRRLDALLAPAQFMGPFYPGVAVALGGLFAAAYWLPDATGRWVYAFTLPISRARLALLRLGAGAVLMLPAVLSLWVVGVIGAAASDLPAIIQVHAGALALRFAAGTLVAYAAGSLLVLLGRKAWFLAGGMVILALLGGLGIGIWQWLIDVFFLSPISPFHVLAGYWLYIDV